MAVCVAALGVLAGCGGSDPTQLKLTLDASPQLNPNTESQPTPTVMRIYDLKSVDKFNAASFFQIYDADTTTLGGDMLSRKEYVIEPGQAQKIDTTADSASQYIGVLVAFRSLVGSNWRAVIKVEPHDVNPMILTLQTSAVTLEKAKPSHFLWIF